MKNKTSETFKTAPLQLVNKEKVIFGRFNTPVKNINLKDANLFNHLPHLSLWQSLRLKEFQVVRTGNKRFFMFFGLVNFKHIGQLIIRIYDK